MSVVCQLYCTELKHMKVYLVGFGLIYMKTQKVYLPLPIPNLRGYHPIACSGKPNPSKRQSHLSA